MLFYVHKDIVVAVQVQMQFMFSRHQKLSVDVLFITFLKISKFRVVKLTYVNNNIHITLVINYIFNNFISSISVQSWLQIMRVFNNCFIKYIYIYHHRWTLHEWCVIFPHDIVYLDQYSIVGIRKAIFTLYRNDISLMKSLLYLNSHVIFWLVACIHFFLLLNY